jgi:serine-type D-Ala-D-Ala carboxypeptidase
MTHSMPAPHPLSPLQDAFDQQEAVFAAPFAILQKAIAQRVFPAASVSITHRGRVIALKSLGRLTYDEGNDVDAAASSSSSMGAPLLASFARSGSVHPSTLFDVASLTKVVATTTAAMLLYERGLLDLDAPVSAIVPEFTTDAAKDLRRHDVTLRMLLAHSSGLPAYEKLFLKARTRADLHHAVFTMPLATNPATHAAYSDIGFVLLGVALERLADEPLDRFCQREIFAPLAMTSTRFNPPTELRAQIPPTVDDRTFRNRIIQGEVYDENASILGGVAAHAGLFSTAADLAKFAHSMLNGGRPILRPETVALFTRRESAPLDTSRALGWDTPSSPSQSGKYFSPQSFGHLGYTGTSLWIDPTRQLSVALLTNRTWPDCSNQAIKQIRPKFHDAIVETLDKVNVINGSK